MSNTAQRPLSVVVDTVDSVLHPTLDNGCPTDRHDMQHLSADSAMSDFRRFTSNMKEQPSFPHVRTRPVDVTAARSLIVPLWNAGTDAVVGLEPFSSNVTSEMTSPQAQAIVLEEHHSTAVAAPGRSKLHAVSNPRLPSRCSSHPAVMLEWPSAPQFALATVRYSKFSLCTDGLVS
jgi:hypothetical protein